jgi:hypothetical protein
MLSKNNLVLPTVYIDGFNKFFDKSINKLNMDLVNNFDLNDIHPGLNLKIMYDGIETETIFNIKDNKGAEGAKGAKSVKKRKATKGKTNNKTMKEKTMKETNIDIVNNDEENKIIKKKQLFIKERRERNRLSAQKCRANNRLKLEEAIKLVEELKKNLEDKTAKLQTLTKELEDKTAKLQKLKTAKLQKLKTAKLQTLMKELEDKTIKLQKLKTFINE